MIKYRLFFPLAFILLGLFAFPNLASATRNYSYDCNSEICSPNQNYYMPLSGSLRLRVTCASSSLTVINSIAYSTTPGEPFITCTDTQTSSNTITVSCFPILNLIRHSVTLEHVHCGKTKW
jgi:hypothetical protein